MTAVDDAVTDIIETINHQGGGAGYRHDQVADQWPALAVALAKLMETCGRKPPGSWRLTQRDVVKHG